MASTDFVDPYLDPETGLLRNKVGARTKVALDESEGDLSFARLVQLMDHPPKATGNLAELRAIHRWKCIIQWRTIRRSARSRSRCMMHDYIMQRTQISLTEEDRDILDAEAARTGRSISALIRDAVEQTYGFRRDAEQDAQAIDAALGAWADRRIDGEAYVESVRSGDRLRQTIAR